MKRAEFKCKADKAEVWLYDQIGEDAWGEGISAKHFIEDVAALGDISELTVRINSPGGQVFDSNSIYNALVRSPAFVEIAIDGVAASGASLIAMAGDHRTMAANAMMMIHQASGAVFGPASEHRALADVLDKLNGTMTDIYATASGATKEQVADWLSKDTWFTAAEAVEAGLASEATGALQVAACIPSGMYQGAPDRLIITPNASVDPEPESSPRRRNLAEKSLHLILE